MISLRNAALILPTTGVVDSKTGLEWGLVNEVVQYKELDEVVEKLWKVWKSTEWELIRDPIIDNIG